MDKTPFQNEDSSPEESNKKELEPTSSSEQELDESWLSLTQDWQAQPFVKSDISALLKQTQRRTLWAKSLLVFDMVVTLGVILVFFFGLYQGDWHSATITYLGLGGLFSLIFVIYEIKIRQQVWQHHCDSPDNAIINAIAGCQSSIKYVLLLKYSTWVIVPLANWYLFVMVSESEKSPWPPFVVMNIFVIAMWGVSHFFHLKRKRELTQLVKLYST